MKKKILTFKEFLVEVPYIFYIIFGLIFGWLFSIIIKKHLPIITYFITFGYFLLCIIGGVFIIFFITNLIITIKSKNIDFKKSSKIAILFYLLGIEYGITTSIADTVEFGYGKLYSCGYWQFNLIFKPF